MQDRDAEIADPFEEQVERQEHRLGDEIEPAPIDQQIEMVEVELLIVAADIDERKIDADDADFLGPGEQPRVGSCRWRPARSSCGSSRYSRSGRSSSCPRSPAENCACTCAVVSGISAAAQYLSVMPIQALVTLKLTTVPLVVDRLVGELLQALVAHYADQALMQDVVAPAFLRFVPRREISA